jgi:hypothetical protein
MEGSEKKTCPHPLNCCRLKYHPLVDILVDVPGFFLKCRDFNLSTRPQKMPEKTGCLIIKMTKSRNISSMEGSIFFLLWQC